MTWVKMEFQVFLEIYLTDFEYPGNEFPIPSASAQTSKSEELKFIKTMKKKQT